MRNVLIATQSFPPINDIAARRYGYLAPHLEEFGWRPWILTTRAAGPLAIRIPEAQILRIGEHPFLPPAGTGAARRPASLLHGWLTKLAKRTAKATGFRVNLLYPANLSWYWNVLRRETQIRRQLPAIDAVVGSYAPTAALFIARNLARNMGVPWIAEVRDLAALRPDSRNVLAAFLDRSLERFLLRSAAGLVTVSPTLADILHREYGLPTQIVYNGWSAEELGVEPPAAPADHWKTSFPGDYLFYAGLLYPHRMSSALLILDVLTRIPDLHFVLRSLGPSDLDEQLRREARRRSVTDRLHLLPRCGPAQVTAESGAALANVVLEDLECRDEWSRGTLTGKFLKLLPFAPPILSVTRTDSDMAAILERTKKGRVCSNVEDLCAFVAAIRRSPVCYAGDRREIDAFSMRTQARELGRMLDDILLATSADEAESQASAAGLLRKVG